MMSILIAENDMNLFKRVLYIFTELTLGDRGIHFLLQSGKPGHQCKEIRFLPSCCRFQIHFKGCNRWIYSQVSLPQEIEKKFFVSYTLKRVSITSRFFFVHGKQFTALGNLIRHTLMLSCGSSQNPQVRSRTLHM